jgi:hypothetical protein
MIKLIFKVLVVVFVVIVMPVGITWFEWRALDYIEPWIRVVSIGFAWVIVGWILWQFLNPKETVSASSLAGSASEKIRLSADVSEKFRSHPTQHK